MTTTPVESPQTNTSNPQFTVYIAPTKTESKPIDSKEKKKQVLVSRFRYNQLQHLFHRIERFG